MKHLARLTPPPDVHARIVSGSLERIEARRRRPHRRRSAFLVLAVSTAAVAWLFFVPTAPAPTAPTPELVVAPPAAPTIEKGPNADLVVEREDDAATELFLARGRATFEIPKRKGRRPFRVRTPSALVEVIGTGFVVRTEGLCTDVHVRHGVVRVKADGHEPVALTAGQSATRCLPEDAVEGETWISEAVRLVAAGDDLSRAVHLLERYRRIYPDGVLEEEALYYLAVAYARTNRIDEGRVVARRLVEKHPNTARAQELAKWFEL